MPEQDKRKKVTSLKTAAKILKDTWGKRDQGIDFVEEFGFDLPVTPEQLLYLLTLYPFVQIVSTEAQEFYDEGPKIVTAKNGWKIHDYGDAISSSLGVSLYMANMYRDLPKISEDEEDDGGSSEGGDEVELVPGSGTVIKQTFDTAREMVEMAVSKGWSGINIISGTDAMNWSIWMAAQDLDLEVDGYTPDEREIAKRRRVKSRIVAESAKRLEAGLAERNQ